MAEETPNRRLMSQPDSLASTPENSEQEPFYPILSIEEVRRSDGTLPDCRDQIDQTTRAQLSAHDHVIHVNQLESHRSSMKPSAIREILRLTKADNTEMIGHNGAALASLASENGSVSPALRKFEISHGRDSLEIADRLHELYPQLLKTTILELAKDQGVINEEWQRNKPFGQELVGGIILLNRPNDDPIGRKFSKYLHWSFPFYGSIDATPSFVSAIATYAREYDSDILSENYVDRRGETVTVTDALDRSVSWIENKLSSSQSGLLEFLNPDPIGGIAAQAWKDSAFAYVHANGERANHSRGIASIDVQSRAYDALMDASELHRPTDPQRAETLEQRAESLRQQVLDVFWKKDAEKGNYMAMAADYDENDELRTLDVRSSNMGHLLNSRLLESADTKTIEVRDAIVTQMFTPELLAAGGIRTLASDEVAFRPGGYHTGSVWLWDSAFIADGLDRHGFNHLAWEVRQRILRTVDELSSFPEFVRGEVDDVITSNQAEIYIWNEEFDVLHLFEQPPQEIQGWTVSAVLVVKHGHPAYLAEELYIPASPLEQQLLASVRNDASS